MDASNEGNRLLGRPEEERKDMLLARLILRSLLNFAPCVCMLKLKQHILKSFLEYFNHI